jgi:hypothetical protein
MTDLEDVLRQVEHDIRTMGSVGEETCKAFVGLPPEDRSFYERAMRILGCEAPALPAVRAVSVPAADRMRASRLMLLRFFRQPDNPAWSSWLLDRLLESVMATPGGSVSDLVYALHEILGEPDVKLTETLKNLITEVVVKSFTLSRSSYESSDFTEMIAKTTDGATPAQAYLALLAIPPDRMRASCTAAILKGLEGTPYLSEARGMLEDALSDSEPRDDARWEAAGLPEATRVGIEQANRGESAPLHVDATLAHGRSHREP